MSYINNMENENYIMAVQRTVEIRNNYGGAELARKLGISHAAVSKWKVIPPFRAYQIAQLGDYKLEYIRPDIKFGVGPQ